jgi:alpha-galactosidase
MTPRSPCACLLFLIVSTATAPRAPAADGREGVTRVPDVVEAITETDRGDLRADTDGQWRRNDLIVTTAVRDGGLRVRLSAPDSAVKHLHLRWRMAMNPAEKYLGDAWERGYGDLQWKPLDGDRVMPWYVLAFDGHRAAGFGVMTGPAALCSWRVDAEGISLRADVRCGGAGVRLGARTLEVCTVVSRAGREDESAFRAAQAFCRQMCPAPLLPKAPVYGFNDWYPWFGQNSAARFREQARFIAELSPDGPNRPFAVIDDGWQAGPGQWDRSNSRFPSMPGLAVDIKHAGARPGIWIRLLQAPADAPADWRLTRDSRTLDPTRPAVRRRVADDVARLRAWGYELIKHDYSTFDLLGRWGFDMRGDVTADGWAFADRSKTTAEILLDHYRTIREAAGDSVLVIGCNTVSHLSAGVFELNRIGDDTGGQEWGRLRKMGVNSLAFRAPQHGTFYAADPDCVALTRRGAIPWDKLGQWLTLASESGMPLFLSVKREDLEPSQLAAIRAALAVAARPQPLAEPLDWLETPFPAHWRLLGRPADFTW